MDNSDKKLLMEKEVISLEYGIGSIVDSKTMNEGDDEFIQVQFKKSEAINYFSLSNQKNYRFVSDKETINKAIKIFLEEHGDSEFTNSQEKINFYKKELRIANICELSKHLSILNKEDELHPVIKSLFDKALASFILEAKHVLDIRNIDVKDMLELETKKNQSK